MSNSEIAQPEAQYGEVRPAAHRRARQSIEQRVWSMSGIIAILLLWQLGASSGLLPARFVSSPVAVMKTAVTMTLEDNLLRDVGVTLTELFIGMTIAIALGIPVGLLAGWYRRLRYAVDPYLAALYATPSLALLPLLVLWFGIGVKSTVVLVIISAFFPIVINIMQGVATVEASYLRMGKSFGAGQIRIFRTIVLPSTIPFLASGLQLGVARGLIGVIVGEMYAASSGGLGYIISVAGSTLAVDEMFVAVTIITALGILLLGSARAFEQRMQRWKPGALE
ncbi:NitT/TauT family transport system permease protein [Rhodoligotrophos appendicifer]|uniref:ABC transporter permease n=1 Tax=Rhodoligotrophos appendicifer TaxID=987056 RepID=UPI001478E565|nr:ABC transporter permease [Rhodoligotrophos appendicifer]